VNVWAYMRSFYPDKCLGVGDVAGRIQALWQMLYESHRGEDVTLFVLCPNALYAQRKSKEVFGILTDGVPTFANEELGELSDMAGEWVRGKNILIRFVSYTESEEIAHDLDSDTVYWIDCAFVYGFDELTSEIQKVVHDKPKKRKKPPVIYLYPRYTTAWVAQMSVTVIALAAMLFAGIAWLWVTIFNIVH